MKLRILTCCIVLSLMTGAMLAQTTQPAAATVNVWPDGKMPGKPATQPETIVSKGDNFTRITNVSTPTLQLFKAAGDKPTPAMIVCPGGGYSYTVIDKEGTEIAQWLTGHGISALVLKYRTPGNRAGAHQDVQRAIRIARANAAEWNFDPKRVGVIGFSAGGHLAGQVSIHFDGKPYEAIDAIDQESSRPDFAVLVYPAYMENVAKTLPKVDVPPTLIIHSDDDSKFIAGSKAYDAALTEAKLPHEFICYQTGGHGYGLHCQREAKAWPEAAVAWLKKQGVP
jgi:acetyl esterase/lipase